jgi:hypothetical protein
MALSYPQKRTAHRVASKRGSYWENSAASLSSNLSHGGGRSRNRLWRRDAQRALSSSAQACQIFVIAQNNGGHAEAGGRSQRQAE